MLLCIKGMHFGCCKKATSETSDNNQVQSSLDVQLHSSPFPPFPVARPIVKF